jgi:uncharacterized protein YjbJ (UPF0337 family)
VARYEPQAGFFDVTHGQQQEIEMNQDRFGGNWKQFGGKVKEQWGRLTNDPQRESAGRRDQLAGRIQERYGIAKEEAARQLKDFRDRNRNWDLANR